MTSCSAPFQTLNWPSFVAVSSAALVDAVFPISPEEQLSVGPMEAWRLAEFSQGRRHARRALAQLGVAEASLPSQANRSPCWPPGFTGSISHVPARPALQQKGHVIAVAARCKEVCGGLGVDLERTGLLPPGHWPLFMSPTELARLESLPQGRRSERAHALWSAKEAAMKALVLPLDPLTIEVEVDDDGLAFMAHCRIPGATRSLVCVNGSLTFEPGWVLALAMLT